VDSKFRRVSRRGGALRFSSVKTFEPLQRPSTTAHHLNEYIETAGPDQDPDRQNLLFCTRLRDGEIWNLASHRRSSCYSGNPIAMPTRATSFPRNTDLCKCLSSGLPLPMNMFRLRFIGNAKFAEKTATLAAGIEIMLLPRGIQWLEGATDERKEKPLAKDWRTCRLQEEAVEPPGRSAHPHERSARRCHGSDVKTLYRRDGVTGSASA
jgi:hypothetical protein